VYKVTHQKIQILPINNIFTPNYLRNDRPEHERISIKDSIRVTLTEHTILCSAGGLLDQRGIDALRRGFVAKLFSFNRCVFSGTNGDTVKTKHQINVKTI